jgi:exonuclease VII large subunit
MAQGFAQQVEEFSGRLKRLEDIEKQVSAGTVGEDAQTIETIKELRPDPIGSHTQERALQEWIKDVRGNLKEEIKNKEQQLSKVSGRYVEYSKLRRYLAKDENFNSRKEELKTEAAHLQELLTEANTEYSQSKVKRGFVDTLKRMKEVGAGAFRSLFRGPDNQANGGEE